MITLVLGASQNPYSYSYLAAKKLYDNGYDFMLMSNKSGTLFDHEILDITRKPSISNIHTIAVYLNAEKQKEWYGYLLSLKPRRIIFNPGAENRELYEMAREKGIEVENSCVLTLLSIGNYSPLLDIK
ncbi:MAG: CoA-binding protein [Cyclobacteriaceae bacterium]|nr:CoA-binding protein [Cyclobacteriaceae bacterium]